MLKGIVSLVVVWQDYHCVDPSSILTRSTHRGNLKESSYIYVCHDKVTADQPPPILFFRIGVKKGQKCMKLLPGSVIKL